MSNLWKLSCPKISDVCKKHAMEALNGRSSYVRLLVGTDSTIGSGTQEIGLSPPSVEQWRDGSFLVSMNLQLKPGFRGRSRSTT